MAEPTATGVTVTGDTPGEQSAHRHNRHAHAFI